MHCGIGLGNTHPVIISIIHTKHIKIGALTLAQIGASSAKIVIPVP
jgi:hypothetical protein